MLSSWPHKDVAAAFVRFVEDPDNSGRHQLVQTRSVPEHAVHGSGKFFLKGGGGGGKGSLRDTWVRIPRAAVRRHLLLVTLL